MMMMMMILLYHWVKEPRISFKWMSLHLKLVHMVLSHRDVITHYDVKTICKFLLYENLCKGVRILQEIKKK